MLLKNITPVVLPRSVHARKKESLAEYFVRIEGARLGSVRVAELDDGADSIRFIEPLINAVSPSVAQHPTAASSKEAMSTEAYYNRLRGELIDIADKVQEIAMRGASASQWRWALIASWPLPDATDAQIVINMSNIVRHLGQGGHTPPTLGELEGAVKRGRALIARLESQQCPPATVPLDGPSAPLAVVTGAFGFTGAAIG